MTTDTRDEEPLAWCPGCGDRILTRVVRERGVCNECWGTRDDPWAAIRTAIAAAISARRTGIRKPTGYDEGWDDALDIAEQIALGELR